MRMFRAFLYGVDKANTSSEKRGVAWERRPAKRGAILLSCSVLLLSCLLVACSSLSFGSSASSTTASGPSDLALSKLHWCGKPLMIFRDEGATATSTPTALTPTGTVGATPSATATSSAGTPSAATPTTLTDWQLVKGDLGFTIYLPATLPAGTCLVSAYGMVHDPILGGSFTIGYLLPDHSALTFSEAPVRSQSTAFACNVTTTQQTNATATTGTPKATPGTAPAPRQVCNGVRDTTSIVFSSQGTMANLQQFFHALQPDVTWIPAA